MFENVSQLTPEQQHEYAKRVASERVPITCDDCDTRFLIRVGELETRDEFRCPGCDELVKVDEEQADLILAFTSFGVLMTISNMMDDQDEDDE
jgi:uncharacterized paraquat-inducible protein A